MGQKKPQNLKKKTALVLFKEIWDLDTFSFGRVFFQPPRQPGVPERQNGGTEPPKWQPREAKTGWRQRT